MDASQLGIVASSISTAIDMAKALTGVRDQALVADKTAALTDKLLQAQQALLAHNAAMFELQNKYFETREELRKINEAISERNRYTLVEIGRGHFAYRANVVPHEGGASAPSSTEPKHYVCQPCFDNGRKIILQRSYFMGEPAGWQCSGCKLDFPAASTKE